MGIRNEIEDMKKEVKAVKEQSLMMDILADYKKSSKRMFIIWLVTFIAFMGLLGYTLYLLNDIGYEETTTETYDMTQEVDDINTINGNIINRGK